MRDYKVYSRYELANGEQAYTIKDNEVIHPFELEGRIHRLDGVPHRIDSVEDYAFTDSITANSPIRVRTTPVLWNRDGVMEAMYWDKSPKGDTEHDLCFTQFTKKSEDGPLYTFVFNNQVMAHFWAVSLYRGKQGDKKIVDELAVRGLEDLEALLHMLENRLI